MALLRKKSEAKAFAVFLSLILYFQVLLCGKVDAEPPSPLDTSSRPAASEEQGKGSAASDSVGEFNFGGSQTWSIIPAGAPSQSRKRPSSPALRPDAGSAAPAAKPGNFGVGTPAVDFRAAAAAGSAPAGDAQGESGTLRLYGRIEELCNEKGARIPLKLQAMTPIRDSSRDLSGRVAGRQTLSVARQNSGIQKSELLPSTKSGDVKKTVSAPETLYYPPDFRGNWTGNLTVSMVNFDQRLYDFDSVEADRQSQLIKPGVTGRCTVNFYQNGENKVELEPTQIVFSTTVNAGEQLRSLRNSSLGALLAGVDENNPALANLQIPYKFALPLGRLSGSRGVSGNEISGRLMKNAVRELAKGVLEQQVVTRDSDRSSNGKTLESYTESVMQFTHRKDDTLYMQAASVSYDLSGNYLNKVILQGLLSRGGSTDSSQETYTLFGAPGQSGAGTDSFGSGAADKDGDLMNQLQQLLNQMGGR